MRVLAVLAERTVHAISDVVARAVDASSTTTASSAASPASSSAATSTASALGDFGSLPFLDNAFVVVVSTIGSVKRTALFPF